MKRQRFCTVESSRKYTEYVRRRKKQKKCLLFVCTEKKQAQPCIVCSEINQKLKHIERENHNVNGSLNPQNAITRSWYCTVYASGSLSLHSLCQYAPRDT